MKSKLLTLPTLLFLAAVLLYAQMPAGHGAVEMKGLKSAIKFEAPLDGFLRPLNGRVKLRATEVDFEPGAAVGDHLHAGPGVRLILAGELTFIQETGKEYVVPTGGYFYESGEISLRAVNRGAQPAKMVVVEVLAGDWQGSAMVPLARRADLEQQGSKLAKQICRSE